MRESKRKVELSIYILCTIACCSTASVHCFISFEIEYRRYQSSEEWVSDTCRHKSTKNNKKNVFLGKLQRAQLHISSEKLNSKSFDVWQFVVCFLLLVRVNRDHWLYIYNIRISENCLAKTPNRRLVMNVSLDLTQIERKRDFNWFSLLRN